MRCESAAVPATVIEDESSFTATLRFGAGEGGAELSDALTAAATGDENALVGWELKASILYPQLEKIFTPAP